MTTPSPNELTGALPRARASVLFQQLPEGAILYCAEQEVYFGLNRTGACIWENLSPTSNTMEELCLKVTERFANTEPATVRLDVERLLGRLGEQRLLS